MASGLICFGIRVSRDKGGRFWRVLASLMWGLGFAYLLVLDFPISGVQGFRTQASGFEGDFEQSLSLEVQIATTLTFSFCQYSSEPRADANSMEQLHASLKLPGFGFMRASGSNGPVGGKNFNSKLDMSMS